MVRLLNSSYTLLLVLFFLIVGCTCPPVQREEIAPPQGSLVKLEKKDIPRFSDDLDTGSLSIAVDRSLHYLGKLPDDRIVRFGKDERTVGDMEDSMKTFIRLIKKETNPKKINKILRANFDIYQPPPIGKKKGPVLFTGYYEPLLDGSLEKTEIYKYPIYKKPIDMVTLDLSYFHPKYKGKKLVGRIGHGTFLPYYNREAIDGRDVLAGERLEMVWLSDAVELFFLHIQGSGKIRLRDGRTTMNVNYAASNGRVYRSIGRFLIDKGILPRKNVNLESIKKFLVEHPEKQARVLNYNESYVFFREVEEGPIGAISEPVTAGRSIATDSALFPKGALAFIETEVPVLDKEGRLKGWKNTSRFVLNQDTGGAIKGTGRVDLFFGSGEEAGRAAGHMKQKGRLYFLIKKSGNRS